MANYTISTVDGHRTVTAYVNGEMLITDEQTNPNFNEITERLYESDTIPERLNGIADLFTAERAVERKFKKISERVSVSGGKVFFDNDPIEDTLSNHLLRLIHHGNAAEYLINFWENIAANPNEHSRESLLRWLEAEDFTITHDGLILGYKGLREDHTSVHAGPAIVDGVEVNGHIPNKEGSVIEMPRSKVAHDPAHACSTGLHVGTDAYARSFGRVTVEVYVNPRDVVSVPTDCNGQKMRVCRYTVGKVSDTKVNDAVVDYSEVDNDFEDRDPSEWNDLHY